jgi:hypothetical protein
MLIYLMMEAADAVLNRQVCEVLLSNSKTPSPRMKLMHATIRQYSSLKSQRRARPAIPPVAAAAETVFLKLSRSLGIDSIESIPPAYVAWRVGTKHYSYSVPSPHRLF